MMKKLCLALAISLLATTTFAVTLTGTVTDPIDNNKVIDEVKVLINGVEKVQTRGGKFNIADFTPDASGWVELKLEKDKYITITGDILCELDSQVCSVDGNSNSVAISAF